MANEVEQLRECRRLLKAIGKRTGWNPRTFHSKTCMAWTTVPARRAGCHGNLKIIGSDIR